MDELVSSAAEVDDPALPDDENNEPRERSLSPLPLLCQPVSDAVRYQLGANSDTNTNQDDGESYDPIMVERSPKAPTMHFIPAYPRNHTGAMNPSQIGARKVTWR